LSPEGHKFCSSCEVDLPELLLDLAWGQVTIMCLPFQIVVPPLPGDALKKQLPFRGDDGKGLLFSLEIRDL